MNYLRRHDGMTKYDDDEVFPLWLIDQSAIVRTCIMHYTFRHDHVLDPEELRKSLVRLLHTGDWRKLAGRLRLNVRRTIPPDAVKRRNNP
jgi:hypothetical protein